MWFYGNRYWIYPDARRGMWQHQMLLGIVVILLALGVVLLPGLLDLIVASVLVMAGVALISSAWRLRRMRSDASRVEDSRRTVGW